LRLCRVCRVVLIRIAGLDQMHEPQWQYRNRAVAIHSIVQGAGDAREKSSLDRDRRRDEAPLQQYAARARQLAREDCSSVIRRALQSQRFFLMS
jgi:hypothetical protein